MTEQIPTIIVWGDKQLESPNEDYTPQQILSFYSDTYPELLNASITKRGLSADGNKYQIDVETKAKTKG